MKRLIAAAVLGVARRPPHEYAQERVGDAGLGAVSGAVVLGPVGAVAGAVIGYTAGPSIARSWGVGRSASRSRARRATQSSQGPQEQAAAKVTSSPVATAPETAAAKVTPPPVAKSPETVAAGKPAPPVQGFD